MLKQHKILIAHSYSNPWGGSSKEVLNIIGLCEQHFNSVLFLTNQGKLLDEVRSMGVNSYRYPFDNRTSAIFFIPRLVRLIQQEQPSIIHTHSRLPSFLIHYIKKVISVVHVHTIHNQFQGWKWLNRVGDKSVAVSQGVKENLIEEFAVKDRKIKVIYNGVNTPELNQSRLDKVKSEFESNYPKGVTKVLCPARLHPQKGHKYLFKAIEDMTKAEKEKFILLLAGEGKLMGELESQVSKLDLNATVHFLGYRDDIFELYKESDFVVLPSIWEGLGRCLIESYMVGTPAIASEVGGVAEVVNHKETGYLVPPKNITSLKDKILDWVENPKKVSDYGRKGQDYVSNKFSFQKTADQYLKLYKEALKERQTS